MEALLITSANESITMAEPTLQYVHCPDGANGHRMAYWQWGDSNAPRTVLCVHGLTRQGRDFDILAQTLLQCSPVALRVVCPDVAGRGESDWLPDPMSYNPATYVKDMHALIRQLAPAEVDWVGTSLGALVGMAVFGHTESASQLPLRRLVLNDAGPVLQWKSLQRIGAYVGRNMHYPTEKEAVDALWAISSGFGPHTPEQWLALSRHMLRADGQGGVRLHYDPAISVAFGSMNEEDSRKGEAVIWSLYDAILAPTLLLRGGDSDLLSADTAAQMTQRGPRAKLVEFAGVGHAPTLMSPDQLDAVTGFLFG